MESVQKEAIGVAIICTIKEDGVAVDVSTVSTKQIIFRKPDGSTVTKTATFTSGGTDGKIQYTTVSGFLDMVGVWECQGYVVFAAGFDGRSDVQQFKVDANL